MREVVGNDVVAIHAAENRASFARPGYVERVLSPRERRVLARAPRPEACFWSQFAAKEAAYKLLVQLGELPGFGHREIEVSESLDAVTWRDHRFELRAEVRPRWVHAVVTAGAPVVARVLEPGAGHDPSGEVRALGRALAAAVLRVPWERLEIRRAELAGAWDGHGPPELLLDGERAPLAVSLSHDGPFVAAALGIGRAGAALAEAAGAG
ncbi:MAG: 4'-phosphopantetheinyl transferase superfamily protein [Polyangiaceae bacterium]|nr:4'-phosphopantetheinyl transferase superfamily protein [Polyangiaceae bacterium]